MSTLAVPSMPELPPPRVYAPEDLLTMPDGFRFELVKGQLVERNMGAESSQVAANTIGLLRTFVRAQDRGKVFAPDCGYQIFPDSPGKVRFFDGSFVAKGRLPSERTPKGHMRIWPDLGLEVVSPNDTADEVEAKRIDYQKAGVRLLWIIYPETRSVHVYRQAGAPTVLGPDDELTGEDVLPGFTCKVSELFQDLD
jgi:Uma2 family endonuclease